MSRSWSHVASADCFLSPDNMHLSVTVDILIVPILQTRTKRPAKVPHGAGDQLARTPPWPPGEAGTQHPRAWPDSALLQPLGCRFACPRPLRAEARPIPSRLLF